jgi:hypothetical protein
MRIVAATTHVTRPSRVAPPGSWATAAARAGAIGLPWRMLSMRTFMGQGLSAASPMPVTVTARMAARASRLRQA